MIQIRRSLVRSQLLPLEFFIDVKSFRSHCGLGFDSASNRNEYQEYFLGGKGGRCVRLTTLPSSCAVVMKSGNLNLLESPGPFQAPNGTVLHYVQKQSIRFKEAGVIVDLICGYIYIYTGCPRRNVQYFGRVFLRSNSTDITQNTYIQSSMVTEIFNIEKWGLVWCLYTVLSVTSYSFPLYVESDSQAALGDLE